MTTEQTINEAAKRTREEKSPSLHQASRRRSRSASRSPWRSISAVPASRPRSSTRLGGRSPNAPKSRHRKMPLRRRSRRSSGSSPGSMDSFDRVSVGFPGVVKEGVVYTAANLGKGWNNYPLQKELAKRLHKPVRMANDADVQGLGRTTGRGVELVITLRNRSRVGHLYGRQAYSHGVGASSISQGQDL